MLRTSSHRLLFTQPDATISQQWLWIATAVSDVIESILK